MKKNRFQLLLGTLLAILVLAGSTSVFAYIMGNDAPVAFNSPLKSAESGSAMTLEQYVVSGAGYYLDSYSDFVLLLNRVELWDSKTYGFNELQILVDGALTKMKNAGQTYSGLVETADATLYNEIAVAKLESLDYKAFRVAKGLNSEIFDEVEADLSKGNIRAIFHRLKSDVENISVKLNLLKEEIEANKFPSIPLLWEINSQYAQTLLYGQYAAQVFNSIKQEM
ncbi:MAG: hypothetical protein KAW12_06150 [Candidatus Aminicenantes bacterium]|nr:hypothetical protein [Candidatus Aminicenantes bacterium]